MGSTLGDAGGVALSDPLHALTTHTSGPEGVWTWHLDTPFGSGVGSGGLGDGVLHCRAKGPKGMLDTTYFLFPIAGKVDGLKLMAHRWCWRGRLQSYLLT